MVVDTVIIPTLVNLTSSFIYDLLKETKIRTQKRNIEKLVKNISFSFNDTVNNSSFKKFLSKPETHMAFNNFILYVSFRKEKPKGVFPLLSSEDFVHDISLSAIQFVKQDSGEELNQENVSAYFENVMGIIEQKLISNLPEELLAIPYFLSRKMNTLETLIRSNYSYEIKPDLKNYEAERIEYIKILKDIYKKSHVYGVDVLELYSFYVFPRLRVEDLLESKMHFADWVDIFSVSNIVSVIGGAGFGKTLFLQNLINRHEQLNIYGADSVLPIYCDLKQFINFAKYRPNYSLEDFLLEYITFTTSKQFDKGFLRYFINSGRCLIMFDALDEVEVSERERIGKMITGFFSVSNINNKVCITSRDRGFIPETSVVFRVHPINELQITEYLEKMSKLGFFNIEDKKLFLNQCKPLIASEFLSSFLILSLLVNIFKAEKELPENKIDLYEKCIDYIAINREVKQKKVKFDFKLMSAILNNGTSFEKLSALSKPNNKEVPENDIKELLISVYKKYYCDKNKTINAIEEFLDFCAERTELYVTGSKDGFYKFFHRSFFEFYYAKHIIKEKNDHDELFWELLKFDFDSEIHELVMALLKKHDYIRYMEFMQFIFDINSNDKFEKFSLNDTSYFHILTALMKVTKEKYFLDEYYNRCFNDKRCLNIISRSLAEEITEIFSRSCTSDEIFNRCIRYYREEVIAGALSCEIILSHSWGDLELNVNFVFMLIYFEFSRNREFVNFISSLSHREFEIIIQKFFIINKPKMKFNFEKYIRQIIKKRA